MFNYVYPCLWRQSQNHLLFNSDSEGKHSFLVVFDGLSKRTSIGAHWNLAVSDKPQIKHQQVLGRIGTPWRLCQKFIHFWMHYCVIHHFKTANGLWVKILSSDLLKSRWTSGCPSKVEPMTRCFSTPKAGLPMTVVSTKLPGKKNSPISLAA